MQLTTWTLSQKGRIISSAKKPNLPLVADCIGFALRLRQLKYYITARPFKFILYYVEGQYYLSVAHKGLRFWLKNFVLHYLSFMPPTLDNVLLLGRMV